MVLSILVLILLIWVSVMPDKEVCPAAKPVFKTANSVNAVTLKVWSTPLATPTARSDVVPKFLDVRVPSLA